MQTQPRLVAIHNFAALNAAKGAGSLMPRLGFRIGLVPGLNVIEFSTVGSARSGLICAQRDEAALLDL